MEHGPILDGDIAERDRLRAVNAKLLADLEEIAALSGMTILGGVDADSPDSAHQDGASKAFEQAAELARAAIEEANK